MKKVYDPELVAAAINASKHREMLRSVNAEIFLAEYNPREYVVMLPEPSPMFQIIISGELSIILSSRQRLFRGRILCPRDRGQRNVRAGTYPAHMHCFLYRPGSRTAAFQLRVSKGDRDSLRL